MKVLLATVLAVVGFAGLAQADGGDEFPSYYPPSNAQPKLCKEGTVEMFLETAADGESTVRVLRTCKNGSFAPATKGDVKHLGCKEGRTEIFIEYSANGDSSAPVQKVCHGGRFVNVY